MYQRWYRTAIQSVPDEVCVQGDCSGQIEEGFLEEEELQSETLAGGERENIPNIQDGVTKGVRQD